MDDHTLLASPAAIEARNNFLAHYTRGTRTLYEADLRIFFAWCAEQGVDPLKAKRSTLEAFIRYLTNDRGNSPRSATRRFQTIRSWFRLALADDLLEKDPTWMVRIPKWSVDRSKIAWLDKHEMGHLLRAAEASSPAHHALVALMGMLGLRVSEACSIRIEDFHEDAIGYTVLTVIRKGGDSHTIPIPVPLLRILERARDGRTAGPLIRRRCGDQQDRHGAYHWIKILAVKIGRPDIHPHSLRHASITALVEAGVPMHEAQQFASHRDIRTTEHYYHRTTSMDRHGAHVTARVFAGAAA